MNKTAMLRMWMLSIIARIQKSSSRCRAAFLPMSNERQQHKGAMLQVSLHMLSLRMLIATASQKGTQKGTLSSTAASLPRHQHPFRASLRLQKFRQQSTTYHRHSIKLSRLSRMVQNLVWIMQAVCKPAVVQQARAARAANLLSMKTMSALLVSPKAAANTVKEGG